MSSNITGERIKERRKYLGITQKDLAKEIHMNNATLSKIESGAQFIDSNSLIAISKVLNVRVDYLLGLDSDTDDEAHTVNTVMRLFDGITTSEKFGSEDKTMYFPEKAAFCKEGNYLVVTAKKRLFNLLKNLAQINGELNSQKAELSENEYTRKRKTAYQWLKNYVNNDAKAAKKPNFQSDDDELCSYLFVSKEQLEQFIDERVAAEIKNRKAIKLVLEQAEDEETE